MPPWGLRFQSLSFLDGRGQLFYALLTGFIQACFISWMQTRGSVSGWMFCTIWFLLRHLSFALIFTAQSILYHS